MNMSIRNRVRIMLFMSLGGLLILSAFTASYVYISGNMEQEKNSLQMDSINSKEINSELNNIRKIEQDYLREPSAEKENEINSSVASLQKTIKKDANMTKDESIKKEYKNISNKIEQYQSSFRSTSSMANQVSGLKKLMMSTSSDFEKLVAGMQDTNLYNQFLLMNKFEKEFYLSNSDKNAADFQEAAQEFEKKLDKAGLPEDELSDFKTKLLKYVSSAGNIQSSSKSIDKMQ